jgi:hypothetical protein
MSEYASAAASGIPTPAPIAASLDEQLGQEADGAPLLDEPFAPPAAVAEPVPLVTVAVMYENMVVVKGLPVTAAPVAKGVTVGRVAVPFATLKPLLTEQHEFAGWPSPQQNSSPPQGVSAVKFPRVTAIILATGRENRRGSLAPSTIALLIANIRAPKLIRTASAGDYIRRSEAKAVRKTNSVAWAAYRRQRVGAWTIAVG